MVVSGVVALAALVSGCPLGLDFDALDRPDDAADADHDADDVSGLDGASGDDTDTPDLGPLEDATDDADTTDDADATTIEDAPRDGAPADVAPSDAADAPPTDAASGDATDDAASDATDDAASDATDDAASDAADDTDTGAPTTCGNGVLDPGEACDDGDDNADTPDTCRLDCMAPRCGDGIVDTGEACDDGNLVPSDACDDTCQWGALGVCETCTRDEECADGLFCNVRFEGGRCMQPCENRVDCPSEGAGMDCDDVRGSVADVCVPVFGCDDWCVDADRDGYPVGTAPDCEPRDCDDLRGGVNPGRTEDCTEPGDRDCDGFAGCDDADCADHFLCRLRREACIDGEDNDGDDAVDCEDEDCDSHEACVLGTCADARPLLVDAPPRHVYTCRTPDRHTPLPLGGCDAIDVSAGEAVFFVDTDVAGRLTVDVRDADVGAAIDARVYLRTGDCADPAGQLACNEELPCADADDLPGGCVDGTQPRHARASASVPAGRVWVFVEALDSDRPGRGFECGRVDVAATFTPVE